MFETKNAIANGSSEIDMVINIGFLKDGRYEEVEEEIKACEIVTNAGAEFIKISTGFSTAGATFDDIALMKEHVGDAVKVKAAGGIRDAKTFMKMVECGAERIGTSAGVTIIKDFEAMMKEQGVSTLEI